MPDFEIDVYKTVVSRVTYVVEADTPAEARKLAMTRITSAPCSPQTRNSPNKMMSTTFRTSTREFN